MLDWELCTLGDALADIAYLLNSWVSAAETIADVLVRAAGSVQHQLDLPNELQPYLLLVAIYLFAMVATEMITNMRIAVSMNS